MKYLLQVIGEGSNSNMEGTSSGVKPSVSYRSPVQMFIDEPHEWQPSEACLMEISCQTCTLHLTLLILKGCCSRYIFGPSSSSTKDNLVTLLVAMWFQVRIRSFIFSFT